MQHDDGMFRGAGGEGIYWQAWIPDDLIGVVVVAHGYAEHSGRYTHVAQRLADARLAVYALDHRGHGRSGGTRANIERMEHVRRDLDALIDRAKARHRDLPVFLLGHSLGGLISLDYVVSEDGASDLAGLVLSGAAVDATVGSRAQHLAAKVLSQVAPNLGLATLDSTAVSRDPAVVSDYESDPLNYRGKIRARTGAESLDSVARVVARLDTIRLPVLVMHGTEDRLASPAGAKLIAEKVSSEDVTLELYDGLYHEIFNEPERDTVLDDVAAWLEKRCG